MKINNLLLPGLAVVFALLLAFFGNLFTPNFNWNLFDFIVMSVLVFTIVLVVDVFVKRVKDNKFRLVFSLLILLLFLFIWAELAVGIFFNLGS